MELLAQPVDGAQPFASALLDQVKACAQVDTVFARVERVAFAQQGGEIGPQLAAAPGAGLEQQHGQAWVGAQAGDLLACGCGMTSTREHPELL